MRRFTKTNIRYFYETKSFLIKNTSNNCEALNVSDSKY